MLSMCVWGGGCGGEGGVRTCMCMCVCMCVWMCLCGVCGRGVCVCVCMCVCVQSYAYPVGSVPVPRLTYPITHWPHRFLGNGLVVIEDYETWRPRRKLYDPAFNKR